MSDHEVKMIILSTDDLDSSIKFYEDLGMGLKFRDGAHFAALDGVKASRVHIVIPEEAKIGRASCRERV